MHPALPDMEIRHFHSREQLMVELRGLLKKGDTVLVKASHYMQFEKVVAVLLEDAGA